MVDIQSVMAEIRQGKREKKKPQHKNIISASATQAAIKNVCNFIAREFLAFFTSAT